MKKIIVIGCPGSGKTTFSIKLAEHLGLPLYHLDAIWHKPDRTHIPREEFDARLGEILALDAWIIDGNYSRTMERRLAASDTVFYFDLPTEVCLAGATARLGTHRPDMPWIDTALAPRFRQEIEEFKCKNSPVIASLLAQYGEGRTVVVFESREAADDYLGQIKEAAEA